MRHLTYIERTVMFHLHELSQKRYAGTVGSLLLISAVIPFCVSCQSKGYSGGSAKDPYAENIPKTKEEEEYYQDVLSGDWKKQMTNPLGYFGLGKYQVSTTPPPHWTMEPPTGSKTMEQVRAETYDKRSAEEQAYAARVMAPASGEVYKTANAAPDPRHPSGEAKRSALPDTGRKDAESAEKPDAEQKEKKENSFFNKWTRFLPGSEQNRLLTENGSLNTEGNLVLRGQAPNTDSARAGQGITSTADAVKSPLKIDPNTAERWRYVDGRGLVTDDVPKDLPNDEYIVVGGDTGGEAFALPNWDVHNLESDETIAHFDTVNGEIKVEPSNRFVIYAPRFGTVRQTVGPKSESQNTRLNSMNNDIAVSEERRRETVDFRTQEETASMTRGNVQTTDMRANQPGGVMTGEEGLIEESSKVLTASANAMLREAAVSDQEKAVLTEGAAAAAAWGKTQGVAVQIDKVAAQGNITLQGAATIYSVDNSTKTSQLRLFKAASKQEAAPGELIEFTIRYENVGNEVIGNVTILDSLSARLEYVDDSAISSKNAEFLVKNNETGSLLLRWEITDPLEPHDFGVLSFLCRVR